MVTATYSPSSATTISEVHDLLVAASNALANSPEFFDEGIPELATALDDVTNRIGDRVTV